MRGPARHRPGFTLIELLVVVAIIAVLIGLLLPAVQKVRESASRITCTNNLKQMGLALHEYHEDNNHFPSGYYTSGIFNVSGWQLQLLPYLDQGALWSGSLTYVTANPGATQSNSFPACNFQMKTYICPSNTRPTTGVYGASFELTSYMGCTGTLSNSSAPNGVLFYNSIVNINQITDGTSNTIAIGERPCTGDLYAGWGFSPMGWSGLGDGDTVLGSNDAYMAVICGDVATNVGLQTPTNPQDTARIDGAHYWSFHLNGANFLFCDGSVHFLPYSASNVFPQLCTIAGGEVASLPF